jgi:hypothetical protein
MITALHARAPVRSPGKARPKVQSITELYLEFEAAHAVFARMEKRLTQVLLEAGLGREQIDALDPFEAGPILTAATKKLEGAWERRFEAITKKCNRITRELVTTPATSLAEVKLKLRIVNWEHRDLSPYGTLEQFDKWTAKEVEETHAAQILGSLQADLLRITATH